MNNVYYSKIRTLFLIFYKLHLTSMLKDKKLIIYFSRYNLKRLHS